jgi:thiol-disulfide isomerase/thioredoxin
MGKRRPQRSGNPHQPDAIPPKPDAIAVAKKERRLQARAARRRDAQRERRNFLLRRWGIIGGAIAVFLLAGFLVVRSVGGGVTVSGDLRDGGHLEAFTMPALQGSGTVSYSSFQDKPLVLNFFASWCPFCVAEMPGFEQVHQKLGSKVQFLGVSQSDSAPASVQLARQTGITYLTASDSQGALFHAFGGLSMPVTVFIKPGGHIAEIHSGSLDPATLSSLIARYFGQPDAG